MCNSKKHSKEEHIKRLTQGRLNSNKWWSSHEKHGKKLKKKWQEQKFYKKMRRKRKKQAKKYHYKSALGLKKKWTDPVWRAKMCKVRKTQSQGTQLRHPKASWYRCKYNGICGSRWMRSGWEVAFALWLDFSGVRWEYETKRFLLSKGRYYHPDFYLPDQDTHVELKGWLTKKDKRKIEKFQKLYPDVKYFCFFQKHLAEVLEFHPKRAA
jgi:hypothetical protein